MPRRLESNQQRKEFEKKEMLNAKTMLLAAMLLPHPWINPPYASAGENTLKWRSFNEGFAEAKKSNKKILIDVYTDWCSWCKKMDVQTYADKNVAAYLHKRYILVKLNAESGKKLFYREQEMTEREFSAAFGISGYPATLFLKSDGEPITIYPGFADARRFFDVISFIAEDHYLTKKFDDYVSHKK